MVFVNKGSNTRESFKGPAIVPQAGGPDVEGDGSTHQLVMQSQGSPASTGRSIKSFTSSDEGGDFDFLSLSAVFTNATGDQKSTAGKSRFAFRKAVRAFFRALKENEIPNNLKNHYRKYDWLQRTRNLRLILDFTFVFAWFLSLIMFLLMAIAPNADLIEERMKQFLVIAIIFTPFWVVNHRLPAATKIQYWVDIVFVAFWGAASLIAEFNDREIFFLLTFFAVQASCPSPLYIRNTFLVFLGLISFFNQIRNLKNGTRNENCVAYMVDSGLVEQIVSLHNKTEAVTAESISTWEYSQLNQTSNCNSIALFLFSKFLNVVIFMILGIIFDSGAKKNFLAMCALHQDKINTLKELTHLQEFTDAQQQQLDNALGGLGSGGKNRISLDEVQFQEKLGQGSFGTVWKALQGGRLCAVKTLSALDADEDNIKRFAFEVEMMERLNHPSIVKMVFAVLEPPKLCLGLELAKCDLTAALKNDLFISIGFDESDSAVAKSWHSGKSGHLKDMVTSIASALKYLHGLEICHRDVKTDNCLVTYDHRCLLADLGEAKKLDSNNTSVGTPYYVAPEVFRGETDYGVEADVYSFGIVLGVCLYHGSVSDFFFWDRARKLSGYVVSQRVLSGWRPKFKPVFEENLPTIVNLIKRCWQNDPMDRPTMKEVHEILAAWEEDAQVTPSENSLVNRQDSEELQRKSFVTFARGS
ncbi:hypothetical protein TrST_g9062 [Triparma strigata]|uniref:Protein kinase domain-containing protein n=1 Tax=Triparma strigata TaxID=1606541 RepID=A0A9W7DVL9_9STRA|nr:hypothetical protein TrST_g9062 [Triparma strigata]